MTVSKPREESFRSPPTYRYGPFSLSNTLPDRRTYYPRRPEAMEFCFFLQGKGIKVFTTPLEAMFPIFVERMNYLADKYPEEYVSWKTAKRLGLL